MVPLEELQRMLGGELRVDRERRWLDTEVGGLRTWIVHRQHPRRQRRVELWVVSVDASSQPRSKAGCGWYLAGDPLVLPRLSHGFVFAGCHDGVLLATCGTDPLLGETISALWELVSWARRSWVPPPFEVVDLWVWRHRRDMWLQRASAATTFALLLAGACVVRWLLA